MTIFARPAARWVAAAVLAAALPLAAGCGGGKGDVSGTVTYKGQPLPYGNIQFISPGGAFVSEISAEGKYSLKGVPVGTSKITITCKDDEGYVKYMDQLSKSSRDPSLPKPKGKPEDFDKIPTKYTQAEQSGLTYEVKSGAQTHDIELK